MAEQTNSVFLTVRPPDNDAVSIDQVPNATVDAATTRSVTAPLRPGDDLTIRFTTSPAPTLTRSFNVTVPAGQTVVFRIVCTGPSSAGAAPEATMPQTKIFAPYIDMLLWPTPNIADVLAATRADKLTLAFVTADPRQAPSWGGVQPLDWPELKAMVKQVGPGRCIPSFGGANGQELAQVITDAAALAAAYLRVADTYGFDTLSFDIEGAAVADKASVARRNMALAQVQRLRPGMKIDYCLPVMPDGLTQDGVDLLKNAKTHGVKVHTLTVMTMDYGQRVQDMGLAALSAVSTVKGQAERIGLHVGWGYGVVPMIGKNDTAGEVFTLDNARRVAAFAKLTPWLTSLSYWSCARDTDKMGELYKSSQIAQKPWEFAHIFAQQPKK